MLIFRNKKLSFMNTGTKDSPVYTRMTKFNSLEHSKNPVEYARTYVDSATEESDVTGYAPSVSYDFDEYSANVVHGRLKTICDDELRGDDALVNILVVDTSAGVSPYPARLRTWAVLPDSTEGGVGTDSSKYTGSFESKSSITYGTAVISADGNTATFTASVTN